MTVLVVDVDGGTVVAGVARVDPAAIVLDGIVGERAETAGCSGRALRFRTVEQPTVDPPATSIASAMCRIRPACIASRYIWRLRFLF